MKGLDQRVLLFLFIFLLLASMVSGQQVPLTILHTNDTHGRLLPFSYPSLVSPGSEYGGLSVRADIGGIARRATLIKRLRKELEGRGTTVWLVDAGDFTDGTPFSTEYHGEADIAAMNAAGYNFGTLGNHEFNNPLAHLQKLLSMFKYPVLCSNVAFTSSGKPLTEPFVKRVVGPIKIGIFGLVTRQAGTYPAAKDSLTISSEIETARRMVQALRPEADVIVAISHSGETVDLQIAHDVPGIDVIVGGHSHTRLAEGEFVWHSDELKPTEVNGTVIVQAHQWAAELGRLDLLFAKDAGGAWHVDRYRARLIPITRDIPEDSEVAEIVDHYWKPIAARFGEVIGEAAGDFTARGDDLAQYNLVADAVRESLGTQLALENIGGVRAPLAKGKITRADVINMDPFDNKLVTFKIPGRELKEIIRKNRPAVSGLRFRLENGVIKELTVAGKPVEDRRMYTGATNSYFFGVAMKGAEAKNTGRLRADVILEYIRKKGTVKPLYDGRRIIIED